jgi:signal transduction histidine kinase/CheY-like chemotaxis protein
VAERRAGGVPDPEAEEVPAGAAPGEPAAAELGDRLREAQETLDSIRRGDFDALLIGEPGGEQLYTLATAERPYRVMVERMKQGALTLSPAGDVLWANGTFAALAGQPLERVIGARFDTLLAAAGDGMPAAGLLVDGGGEAELELARGDDPPVPVAVSVTEIVDQGTRSFCAIVTDLTHQRVHERLRDSERRLREMDRRKDEFLAMLGHELRNPLAPIAHAAELLRREAGELSQRGEWALAVIERQLLHVRRMVDDLLDIGRITRGRVELRRGAVDLAEVVTAAAEGVHPLLEQRGHRLEVVPPATPLWVDGDPTRLAQAVGNLIHNAAKYSAPGGRVRVVLEDDGGDAVVRVEDEGQGISEELLPRVFDLFTQGEATLDRTDRGLGLGLTLVRRIVEMHGGEVSAASPGPGRGSRFEIRLPRLADHPAAGSAERATEPLRPPSGRRVLVVDDNLDAAQALAMLLAEDGHEVRVAADADTALGQLEVFTPEVALLDIGLPGMDGYELGRRLRRRLGAGLLLVAVTGYGKQEDAERSRRAGFDRHLVKPVDVAELEALVAGRPPAVS